jgi:hypothetical protein
VVHMILTTNSVFSLNNMKQWDLVAEAQYVYYEVGSEFLHIMYVNSKLVLKLSWGLDD